LPYRSDFDLLGLQVEVVSNSAAFHAMLDRLQAGFHTTAAGRPAIRYMVRALEHGREWALYFQGEELAGFDDAVDAAGHVEWHMCGQAIERRQDLLHVHGAALCAPSGSVLLPGSSGIGKTTFALALALRGLRMLSDDVVFVHPDTRHIEPFPRSFHVHDDALPRLEALGLRYTPADRVGDYLCSTALGPWDRTPGPPLRFVILPRLVPDGPNALQPLTAAEATLELMRCSKNLRRFPRFGLDLVPRLLEGVRCYVLQRNDDLAAAAALVDRLVTEVSTPDHQRD
jgi:hypothetical protein